MKRPIYTQCVKPRPQKECIDTEKILRLSRKHIKEIDDNVKKMFEEFGASDTNRNNYICKKSTQMEYNDIIGQCLNKIIIHDVVVTPLGGIIQKYTKRWFSADGTFAGFDAVAGDLDAMTDELNYLLRRTKATLEKAKQMEAEISSFDEDIKWLIDDTETLLQCEKEIEPIIEKIMHHEQQSLV